MGNIWRRQPKHWGWWLPAAILGRWNGLGWPVWLLTTWAWRFGSCQPELDLQVQDFLSREEPPYAGNDNDSNWSSTLEPLFEDSNKWALWGTCWVETPVWWPELWRVPNQKGTLQFTRWVQVSFQMPKVRCHTLKTKSNYSLRGMCFCPSTLWNLVDRTIRWSKSRKLQGITVLGRKGPTAPPGQWHQFTECMWELRESMEPMATFTDGEVLHNDVPLHWVKITSSRTSESAEPAIYQEQSQSRSRRACSQGSFLATYSIGWAKPTTTTPCGEFIDCLQPEGKDTTGQPQHTTAKVPAWFCGHSQVPVGRQLTTHICRSPTGADSITRSFGGVHHSHDGFYETALGCGVGNYLPRHGNHLYEPCGFGGYP